MDFFEKIVAFLLPVLVWYYFVFAELYKKETRQQMKQRVGTFMSKVLYIVAKGRKKDTSAGEDILNNMTRGQGMDPIVPDVLIKEPVIITQEEPIEVPEETVTSEAQASPTVETKEEVKPFSDPVPSEPPPREEADVTVRLEFPELHNELAISTLEKMNILLARIGNISDQMTNLQERVNYMALNLETLQAEVARAKTVQSSAVELIKKVVVELESVSADLAAKLTEPPVDTSALDALTADLKASTDSLAAAVADSVDVLPTHTVVLNADNPEVPTVEVVLPEVLPEVVEATVEQVVETVDPTSSEPQIQIVVEEAAPEVVETVEATAPEVVADPEQDLTTTEGETIVTGVVETDEGEANVTVAAPVEEAAVAEAAGVDVVEAVAEAYEAAPEVVAVPEEPVNTDNATTPETGGAPMEGAEGTQAGETAEKPAE